MQNKQILNDFYKRLRGGLAKDIVGTCTVHACFPKQMTFSKGSTKRDYLKV